MVDPFPGQLATELATAEHAEPKKRPGRKPGTKSREPVNITKRTVDAIIAGGKPGLWWDQGLRGFGFKLTDAGKGVYVMQYRVKGSPKTLRYTIGRHGDALPPAKARETAEKIKEAARLGKNPHEELRAQGAIKTLTEFWDTYYDRVRLHSNRKTKSERTKDEEARLFEQYLKPEFGRKKLTEITEDAVRTFHDALRNKPITGNRCLALLSHMLNMAMAGRDMPRTENPCKPIRRYPEGRPGRSLSGDDYIRVLLALKDARNEIESRQQEQEARRAARTDGRDSGGHNYHFDGSLAALDAITVLLWTGARRSEIMELKWQMVDLPGRCLRLPTSKTGPKVVQLGNPAIEVLERRPRVGGSDYVFPGEKHGRPVVGVPRVWKRICARAGLPPLRLHDLRHAFTTALLDRGTDISLVQAIMGHARIETTLRYAHAATGQQQEAVARVTDAIVGLLAAPKPGK